MNALGGLTVLGLASFGAASEPEAVPRELKPGRYAIRDYVEGKDIGVVVAGDAALDMTFTNHLLLETVPVP
jgi:hypothetical protein